MVVRDGNHQTLLIDFASFQVGGSLSAAHDAEVDQATSESFVLFASVEFVQSHTRNCARSTTPILSAAASGSPKEGPSTQFALFMR